MLGLLCLLRTTYINVILYRYPGQMVLIGIVDKYLQLKLTQIAPDILGCQDIKVLYHKIIYKGPPLNVCLRLRQYSAILT